MPKGAKQKFYAVLHGRGGTKIYLSREEYRAATLRFSGASSKGFYTHEDAEKWLESSSIYFNQRQQGVAMIPTPPPTPGPSSNRLRYPNSSKYWANHKPNKVDVGVQTYQLIDVDVHATNNVRRDAPHDSGPRHCPPATTRQTNVPEIPQPPANHQPCEIRLSDEQRRVLDLVKSGESVFFTGPAGTGKSVLLRAIIQELRRTTVVAVTATTGIAGLNIAGSTVHSFAGVGLGKEPAEKLADKISNSTRLRERWKSTKVLIVDEISMMDALWFDKLEYIARVVRECPRPFGGIQLVLSGDFFQLPPVPEQSYEYKMAATYAFDANSWSKCIPRPIFLSQVFRQKDNTFVDILSSMRQGKLTPEHVQSLIKLSRPLRYDDGIEPSYLFPLRKEVEACNNGRLAALTGPEHVYCSTDSAGYDYRNIPIAKKSAELLLDRLVAVKKITLKIGAQVMLIQNIEQGVLVNGSAGKVVEFLTTHEAVKREIQIATFNPAKTIPQAPPPRQSAELDLYPVEDLGLRPINNNVFSHREKWPLVHFTNGCELLCAPLQFTVEGFMGNVEAMRLQVPLILAWAMTIHKCQGQTLERVKVDLGHIFEKGQGYVALSRATTMEHLQLENFQPSKVMAHPRVLRWQEFWTGYGQEDSSYAAYDTPHDEMDSEEALSLFWDDADTSAPNV